MRLYAKVQMYHVVMYFTALHDAAPSFWHAAGSRDPSETTPTRPPAHFRSGEVAWGPFQKRPDGGS